MFNEATLLTGSKYFYNINATCNEKDAYQFDPNAISLEFGLRRIGYLVNLSFPSLQKRLVPDLDVCCPEESIIEKSVVGVLGRVRWDGGANDLISLTARLSFQNKAILQEALSSLEDSLELEAEWVIYEYDYHTREYFKRFHTNSKAVTFLMHADNMTYFNEDPDYGIQKPINFSMDITLTPKKGSNQELQFAFRAGGTQFTRQVGI